MCNSIVAKAGCVPPASKQQRQLYFVFVRNRYSGPCSQSNPSLLFPAIFAMRSLYTITLAIALAITWLLWSGHFYDPWLLALGLCSCLLSLYLSRRMGIIDEEGAPANLGLRPFTHYAPWLVKEIVVSNFAVAKLILAPKMKLMRNMVKVPAHQQTELGLVIFANSITLTPGTISVGVGEHEILVHALSFEGAAEDLSGEMDQKVCRLESPMTHVSDASASNETRMNQR